MPNRFGSDPEFFISDGSKNSDFPYIVPPAALITDGGLPYTTKKTITSDGREKTIKIIHSERNFSILEDGAAFEVNIAATEYANSFYSYVMQAKQYLSVLAGKYGLSFSDTIVGNFDTANFWQDRDESFRDCVTFGCDPDSSFYRDIPTEGDHSLEPDIPKQVDVSVYPYRFGGGHLHIEIPHNLMGPDSVVDNYKYAIAFMCDAIIQTKNIILHERDPEAIEHEKVRLQHYGNPGRFRIQPHGIEYRPLSNWWLRKSDTVSAIIRQASLVRNTVYYYGSVGIDNFMEDMFPDRHYVYESLKQFDIKACKDILKKATKWLPF